MVKMSVSIMGIAWNMNAVVEKMKRGRMNVLNSLLKAASPLARAKSTRKRRTSLKLMVAESPKIVVEATGKYEHQ